MPQKSKANYEDGTSFKELKTVIVLRACIYVTPDLCCSLIPMFSNEDLVAIRVNNACRKGDSFVFVSAYMAAEEPAPPNLLRDLLVLTEIEQISTILETDANAHHTIWGSSDINPRGKDLLAYCASAEADINQFQPFKGIRARRALSCTATERLESTERILPCHFSSMPETQQCSIGMERRHRYISPQTGKGKPV